MTRQPETTVVIQQCLDRLRAGDAAARDELIRWSCGRLQRLTRRLLQRYPAVQRWEETDDVFQNATIRLCAALADVHPESVSDFMRLAALQIRRELIDLLRHYQGPQGMGAHHRSHALGEACGDTPASRSEPAADTAGPSTLAEWTEFHQFVQRLPDAEREVFDLRYYAGLSHDEVAATLQISSATSKRRWLAARLRLHQWLHGTPAGEPARP